MISTTLLPDLLTPQEFAVLMEVGRETVWSHINKGKIEIVTIGKNKKAFIDPAKYSQHEFSKHLTPKKFIKDVS